MSSHISRMRRSTKARHFITIRRRPKESRNEAPDHFKQQKPLGTVVVDAIAQGDLIKAALTETQGLELVLGVGERCTVTSAIQRPGSGHLRGSDRSETIIIDLGERKPS